MSKTLLKQMEIFDMITQKGLSPNQYYVLCSMKDSVTPIVTNLHLELRLLKSSGWITETTPPKITPEAQALITKVERLFKVQKKKTTSQLLGKDYKEKLKQYIELFPNVKLPSGSAARSAPKNVETRMRWFFENNEYDWDLILKATAVYVDEYQSKNWKFMRNCQYFVKKQERDGTILSDLANYCAIVESGGDVESTPTFKSKVV